MLDPNDGTKGYVRCDGCRYSGRRKDRNSLFFACHRNPPTHRGFPNVADDDWCASFHPSAVPPGGKIVIMPADADSPNADPGEPHVWHCLYVTQN